MADWLFDRSGSPTLILDDDRVRDRHGHVIGWVSGGNIYSLGGRHVGWFDGGVIYDSRNRALAFTRSHTGTLPSVPGLHGTPGMPGFSGIPGRPGFSGTPGMPGRSGWSEHDAAGYFLRPLR
jgi:hypothetical protein